MTKVDTLGNEDLLGLPGKVAFLASRGMPSAALLRCYAWAERIRDGERCIIGGFQSPLEQDVLQFLLRGKAPIVYVLARTLWKRPSDKLYPAIKAGRLLLVAPFLAKRVSIASAQARNRYILEHCSEVVLGHLTPTGHLHTLLSHFPDLPVSRIDHPLQSPRQGVQSSL